MPTKSLSITLKSCFNGTQRLDISEPWVDYFSPLLRGLLLFTFCSHLKVGQFSDGPIQPIICRPASPQQQQEAGALPLTPLVSALMRDTVAALCSHTHTHRLSPPLCFLFVYFLNFIVVRNLVCVL